MDSYQQRQGGYRGEVRPRYFRNSRGNAYASRQHQNNHPNRNASSSNVVDADSAATQSSSDLTAVNESNPSRSYYNFPQSHSKTSKNRNNSYPRYSQSTDVHRTYENSQLNPNAVSFTSIYDHPVQETESVSQRGKIIGGRYIRQHANNSAVNTHSNNSSSYENTASYEQNSNFSSYSNANRSKSNSYENQRGGRSKGYSSSDARRPFTYKPAKTIDYSSRSSQNSGQNANENVYATADVYRYSSQSANEKRTFKPKEYNHNRFSSVSNFQENDATQRELLIQQLNKGDYECLVCCEQIRVKDQTWHCLSCYHVFHLRCIRKWARSPAASSTEGSWRCPACQSLTSKVPYDYFCFCGVSKNPEVNYHLTPHSCGEICGRSRPDCTHRCNELCHPGPCPPCAVVVQKSCPCGKTTKVSPCKQDNEDTCNSLCEKVLNCRKHRCKNKCHPGECTSCEELVPQECYCNGNKKSVICDANTANVFHFSCDNICARPLSCGNHNCESICHPGSCKPCSLSAEVVKYCPCGKSSIRKLIDSGKAVERKSCKDPIPLCNEKCEKVFCCGPKDDLHRCQSLCHEGECPKCLLETMLKCRCGGSTKQFNCADITPSFVFLCQKRCNRRKDCGRHKCLNNCCINIEHRCELICNKKLSCGNHQCQETCHAGNCPTCWNVSFDELRCHCGEAVLYPPIHCGTKPPECTRPCIRQHPCEHEVKHYCHSEETCPPCTSLTVKWCFGHHKQCAAVMCFMDGVSCGMMCLKELPCGNHKCNLTCHAGPCLKDNTKCTQECLTPRATCGHYCGIPCHTGDCPDTPCKSQVTLNCPCGHRSETATCHDSTKSYRLMSVSVLATKMQEIKDGQSVNLNDVLGKKSKNSKLVCNEECAVIERNKRLAVALQIQNPDLSTSLGPPNYSEFLKTETKKNPVFVTDVYDKITELVQLAKESKQKCRSHSFPPMNRDHRRVVHELAEFFGCETQSYDEEPKKSVVVTAHKTKCWLPFVSIMTVVQRDMGFRKGPTPLLTQREPKNPSSNNISANSQKKKIDYFDYNE